MVNKYKLLVTFTMITLLFSCSNLNNPKERNRLVFDCSIDSISNHVKIMNQFLLKTKHKGFTYGIDIDMNDTKSNENDSFLYISNDEMHTVNNIGIVTDSLIHRNKLLVFIDSSKRKDFVNLVLILNKNHLSSCAIENGNVIYQYRANIYMADRQKDLDRYVILVDSEKYIDSTKYKILDRKRNLFLLAEKDAKIWTSN